MDAVQKVGNGHPGTAMSLAPGGLPALPEGDAAQPRRPALARARPLRPLVRPLQPHPLHPALPRRLGPRARRPQGAAHLGFQDPRPPRVRPHRRRRDDDRPARPGRRQRGRHGHGRPPRARHARPQRRRRATSPFDHQIYAICSDGDIEEGVSAEASAIAGVQQLGNLTVIYDANRISIEDDTDIALAEDVAARYEAYGWHVQTVDWTNDEHRLRRGRPRALRRDPQGPRRHRPAQLHRAAHDHRLARPERCRTPARPRLRARRRRGRRHQEDPRLRPRADLRGARRTSSSTPARRVARGKAAQAAWDEDFAHWADASPRADRALFDRLQTPHPARRLGRRAAHLRGRRQGRRHPRRPPARSSTRSRRCVPELWGGSADLAGSNNTTIEGVPSFLPRTGPPRCSPGDPLRRPGAALRHPRARHGRDHERHRQPRRHPRLRRHLPHLLRLHAPLGPAGLAHAAAGHLRVDPRLDRPRRGRPDPPADRAPRRAARHPRPRRRTPRGRQRDGRGLADGPRAQRPARRAVPEPAERADLPARRGRLLRHQQRPPRRLRPARQPLRPGGHPRRRPDRHRLRGPARRRGARAARRRGHRRPGRVDAVPRVVRRAGDVLPRDGHPAAGQGPRVGRGRHRPGLARDRRRPRPDRLHRALRRLRRLPPASTPSSASPRRPSPTPPATASRRPPPERPAARPPTTTHTEEHHERPSQGPGRRRGVHLARRPVPRAPGDRQPRRPGHRTATSSG